MHGPQIPRHSKKKARGVGNRGGLRGKMPKMTRAYHLPLFPYLFKAPGKDARNFLSRRLCFFSFGGGANETFSFDVYRCRKIGRLIPEERKPFHTSKIRETLNICNVDNDIYHAYWPTGSTFTKPCCVKKETFYF